jgi:hypothetical protein
MEISLKSKIELDPHFIVPYHPLPNVLKVLHNVFTTIHRSSSALAVTSFMVPLFTLAGSETMS